MTCSSWPGSALTRSSDGSRAVTSLMCSPIKRCRSDSARVTTLVEIEHLRLQDLLAAEGQQLLGQRRGAFAGPPHLLDVGARGMPGLEFLEHEVAVAEDGREQVVEVVGDAAGQASDGFHLARLLELILERAARVLHLRPRLEIVDQPLLGTFDLARHDVEGARQPANLIATGAADASRVVALGDGFSRVGQRRQRRGDLPGKQRHQDHRAPHQHCRDEEDPAEEVPGRRHHGLARKLDPDPPRRVCDLADGSDVGRAIGRARTRTSRARRCRPAAAGSAARDRSTRRRPRCQPAPWPLRRRGD